MAGQGASRNGGLRLTLQALQARPTALARSGAALSRSCTCRSACVLLRFPLFALFGRLQRYPCPAGLRQADGDGLLRRPSPMLTLTNVLDLLANELACCGCRAFPGTKICSSLLYCGLLRHSESPPCDNLGRRHPNRCASSHLRLISFSSGKRSRAVSSGLQRSPSFRTRSGTLAIVKSVISKPASTSSHVTGVDTVALYLASH